MRTQTLDKHRHFDGYAKGSHVKGHLNGLLIVLSTDPNTGENYPDFMKFIDDVKLKVKYVEDRVRTLVPSVPVANFLDITNQEYGSTNEVGSQKAYFQKVLLNVLANTQSTDEGDTLDILRGQTSLITNQSSSKQIQIYVDLGSIYVDGGNELHYEFSGTNTNSRTNIEVYAISKENEPSHFLEYDMDTDRNEMHQNIVSSYICSPKGAQSFPNIDFTIDATSVQYETNTKGLLGCASLFSRIENVALGRTLKVFEAESSVPEDVQVKFISDEDITGFYILNVRIDTTIKGYVAGKKAAIQEKAMVLSRLETAKPELTQVLQLEGMPTSNELKDTLR
jgi:hypothetical protein